MRRLPLPDEDYDLADIGAEPAEDDPPITADARASHVATLHTTAFVQAEAAQARHTLALVRAARALRDQRGELFMSHWSALFTALAYFKDWSV